MFSQVLVRRDSPDQRNPVHPERAWRGFEFAEAPTASCWGLTVGARTPRLTERFPYMQFYVADWRADAALSMCLPATRGIWMDLICAMHENDRSGELRGTADQLARIARCRTEELVAALTDLESQNAADIETRNGVYRVSNRRMTREAEKRNANKSRQKKHRDKNRNGTVTRESRGIYQNQSQNQKEPNPPPTPRHDPPPVPDGGRSENVHPAERFRAMRNAGKTTARAILAAYPKPEGSNAAINAVADALVRVGRGSDAGWPPEAPPPADPAAWLLARVRAYAASADAKRDGGVWVPGAVKWFGEGRYLDPDEAWNRQREQAGPVQVESAESLLARLDSIK